MFLEGEDMMEYRDKGLNDTCSMSISTAAQYTNVWLVPQEPNLSLNSRNLFSRLVQWSNFPRQP